MREKRMRRQAIAFAVGLVFAGAAWAQAPARVTLQIKDEQTKEPIEGAMVEVSLKATNFKDKKATNKKGQAIFTVQEAGPAYDVAISADGYQSATSTVKPVVGKSAVVTFTLIRTGSESVAATSGEPAKLTPAQEMFNQGVLEQQSGNTVAAREKFLKALELDPQLHVVHSAMAGIYLIEGNAQKALESAQILIQAEPANPRGYRALYEAQRMLGKGDDAEATLEKLAEMEKGGEAYALYYNEGAEAAKVGDFKVARERLEKALQMKPDLIQAMSALMLVYMNTKEYAKAAPLAESVLQVRPEDLTAKRVRWDAYNRLGDQAKAQEAFAILAAADPRVLIKDLFDGAQGDFNNGDTQSALAKLGQIFSIDANHVRSHYLSGLCYVNLGQNAKAKEHLEKFLALAPEDAFAKTAKEMIGFLGD